MRPSNVTAENAAAGLGAKSPNDHTHDAGEIAGLARVIDASFIAQILDNDVVEIVSTWLIDFDLAEWSNGGNSTTPTYVADFPATGGSAEREIVMSRTPSWLAVDDSAEDFLSIVSPGRYKIDRSAVVDVVRDVESPQFENSYTTGTCCFDVTTLGRADCSYENKIAKMSWSEAKRNVGEDGSAEDVVETPRVVKPLFRNISASGFAIARWASGSSFGNYRWGNETTGCLRVTETITVRRYW